MKRIVILLVIVIGFTSCEKESGEGGTSVIEGKAYKIHTYQTTQGQIDTLYYQLGSGYYVLSKQSHLIYKVSELFDKKNESGILWNDKMLNIKWPCRFPKLSDNDKKNASIKDINLYKYKDLLKL